MISPFGVFMSYQVNVDANGQNIVGDAANECSISVDPTNPSKMAVGWRQFDNVHPTSGKAAGDIPPMAESTGRFQVYWKITFFAATR